MKPITQDDILDAMQAAMQADTKQGSGVGASVRELMQATGRNQDMVRDWLRRGLAAGTVEVVRVKRAALDGRIATVSAYKLHASKK